MKIPTPKHIADMFEMNYIDNRAILGQQAMNFIMQHQEVYDKVQKAWFHYHLSWLQQKEQQPWWSQNTNPNLGKT